MEPKSQVLTVALVLLVGAAADDQIQTLDGCQSACGGVPIPYPFGVGNSSTTRETCFLKQALEPFELTCVNNILYWANIQVTAINITQGKVDMMSFVSEVCYNSSYGSTSTSGNDAWLKLSASGFTISSEDNKFVSVGCDTYGYLNSLYGDGAEYATGCLTRCYNSSTMIVDGECSGIGCCQVDIPPWMRSITTQVYSFENFKWCLSFNKCGYSFVVKNGNYTFSKDHLLKLPHETMPVVFDWAVGNETCEHSRDGGTNACRGNATCVGSSSGSGYQCRCKDGYEGNPYHPDGCLGNN